MALECLYRPLTDKGIVMVANPQTVTVDRMNAQATDVSRYPDSRGPLRTILSVGAHPDGGVALALDCGHTSQCVSHFTYLVGSHHRCFTCGQDAIREWRASYGVTTTSSFAV